MSTTVIFLIGLVAANLCLAFAVATFVGLRHAADESRADRQPGQDN